MTTSDPFGPAAAPNLDSRALRDALGRFATGVAIVTTRDAQRRPVGVTANSFSSVSLDPPLVLFSLARRAYSRSAFESFAAFAVNVLARGQHVLSSRFAAALADKWSGVEYDEGATGCPVLPGALAVFECALHAVHDGGDHVILVGRVVRLQAAGDGEPLLFWRGAYRAVGGHVGRIEEPSTARPAPMPDGATAPFVGLEPWLSA